MMRDIRVHEIRGAHVACANPRPTDVLMDVPIHVHPIRDIRDCRKRGRIIR